MRPDGYVFNAYVRHANGNTYERWLSPDAYHRKSVQAACDGARHRAKKKNLPFDIDTQYLLSIFPSDSICPALLTPMVWGGECRGTSPSLDRRIGALGYVRGNVEFISHKANTIKADATTEEIFAVAEEQVCRRAHAGLARQTARSCEEGRFRRRDQAPAHAGEGEA